MVAGSDSSFSSATRPLVAMDKLVSLCAARGFIFASSEIYGGINGFWDYGPLGVELKNNLKALWWQRMVRERPDVVGIDTSIVAHPRTWEASGHVDNFSDPMVDCRACKKRFRADQLDDAGKCPSREGSSEHDLIADGLSENIIAVLSQLRGINIPGSIRHNTVSRLGLGEGNHITNGGTVCH